jgi:predicted ATPase
MHLKEIRFMCDGYPTKSNYPFDIGLFSETKRLSLDSGITFFVGENGTGKSTLLRAIAQRCGVHIWEPVEGSRMERNVFERLLYRFIDVTWTDGPVSGSFFASEIFNTFAEVVEELGIVSKERIGCYGGRSLITQSHGQSHMSYFRSRYQIKGLYFLDEPENALSPKRQLELLKLLEKAGRAGHAQFIIATHSPLLLACPEAVIYSFDRSPISRIEYEATSHFRLYRDFFENRNTYLRDQ